MGHKKDFGVTENVFVNEPNCLPRPCPGEVLRSRHEVGVHFSHGINNETQRTAMSLANSNTP